jgi:TDG/mug DNA glycosylase family protein
MQFFNGNRLILMQYISSFGPVAGPLPAILILGTMPSTRSLERKRYYGHERNHFWPVMAALLDETLPGRYEARLVMLKRHGVALWDVAGSCTRSGSRDGSIKNVRPNDIPAFLNAHPTIHTVVFNGQTARKLYDRFFERIKNVVYLTLPSTSPIPTRQCRNLEEKIKAWESLALYLPRR